MSRARPEFRSAPFVHPVFGVPAAGAIFLVPAALLGVPALPLAFLGIGIGIVTGLLVALNARSRARTARRGEPGLPPELAADPELGRLYQVLYEALLGAVAQPDGDLRETLVQRLIALGVQFRALASGSARAFAGTESWYVAHDAVLAVPELKEYRAVVRIRTAESIRSPAHQESLRVTLAAARRGVLVERILVFSESLWPADRLVPVPNILPWIEDQQAHGFRVIVARERDFGAESAFDSDTCVFDDWAVGTRDLDDRAQTTRVALDFVPAAVRAALERLERASQIGIPFGVLLERADRGG